VAAACFGESVRQATDGGLVVHTGRLSADRAALRTPRAAAVAGIVFSVLVIITMVLLRISVPAWVELLFPAWILALSVDILVAGRQ
jgi:hypothetical protein